jgi:hypothetical protein
LRLILRAVVLHKFLSHSLHCSYCVCNQVLCFLFLCAVYSLSPVRSCPSNAIIEHCVLLYSLLFSCWYFVEYTDKLLIDTNINISSLTLVVFVFYDCCLSFRFVLINPTQFLRYQLTPLCSLGSIYKE